MGKKKDKFCTEEMKTLCRKYGIEIKPMKAVGHFRLVGGLAVDVWPKGGTAWIFGTRKSWKPETLMEIIEVANLKKIPSNAEWLNKNRPTKEVLTYLNVENCCPLCRKKIAKQDQLSTTDRMIDLREFLGTKEERINTKSFNGA